MNRKLFILALCSATAFGLAACGDDSGPRDSGGIVLDSSVPTDGDTDSGSGPDTGTRPDTSVPPESCDVGDTCDPTRGCRVSPFCIGESAGEIGGVEDPIMGVPGGGNSVSNVSWTGGYCTSADPIDMGGCDPNDDDSCGGLDCAVCLNAGTDARGVTVGLCTTSCTPSLTDNGACRDTYECGVTSGGCVPGCTTDDECRVFRKDTNMNGIIDPYDAVSNATGDALVYDDSVNGTCNLDTYSCRQDGGSGIAGDNCTDETQCEANGSCISDDGEDGGWTGGYCTKFGCDLAGNDCAAPGKCQERGLGIALCTLACQVSDVATADDPYSANNTCAAGFSCFWDGTSGDTAGNGACVPGNYNAIRTTDTTGQTGQTCTDESDCNSPFGLGQCRDFGAGDHCTLFDCAAPGLPADVCGTGNVCATVSGSDTTLCAKGCTSADECLDGNGCWDTSPAGINTGGVPVCFPGCLEDSHCPTGETCAGASATAVGECM